jgi:TraM recognition site of TraD and TraG
VIRLLMLAAVAGFGIWSYLCWYPRLSAAWAASAQARRGRHLWELGPVLLALVKEPRLRARPLDTIDAGMPPCEIPLGTRLGRILTGGPDRHVLFVGPPRSGKSRALAAAIKAFRGPLFCATTRTDLHSRTRKVRRGKGTVWLWDPRHRVTDPRDLLGVRRITTRHIFDRCRTWEAANALGAALTAGLDGPKPDDKTWRGYVRQMLACMLHAAALEGYTVSQMLGWVYPASGPTRKGEPSDDGIIVVIRTIEEILELHDAQTALARLRSTLGGTERMVRNLWSVLRSCLVFFDDPDVLADADTPDDGFDAERFVLGSEDASGRRQYDTVQCVIPCDEGDVDLSLLMVALFEEVRLTAVRLSDQQGGHLHESLLAVLDEFLHICPFPALPVALGEHGGRGIIFALACQTLAPAAKHYSDAEIERLILNNCESVVILRHCKDEKTLGWAERICGQEEVEKISRNYPERRHGLPNFRLFHKFTEHVSTHERSIWPASRIHDLGEGMALIVGGRHHRTVVNLLAGDKGALGRWDRIAEPAIPELEQPPSTVVLAPRFPEWEEPAARTGS